MTAAALRSNSCGVVTRPIVPGMDLSGTPKGYSVSRMEATGCDVPVQLYTVRSRKTAYMCSSFVPWGFEKSRTETILHFKAEEKEARTHPAAICIFSDV